MAALLLPLLANWRAWAGVAFAGLLAFAGVQTARLSHAKADLTAARAALVDPASHRTWQAEAVTDLQNLATARLNAAAVSTALNAQNAAVEALKARGAQDTAAAQAAAAQTRNNAKLAADEAAKTLATPSGPDPCKSADDLILGSLP